ncbi:hypothetical protein WMY93_026533 [Mugilogobius chulae]|uniref:C-type natriuretic peptide n=1 Tax=Mugilogobius chulae TaxID=88201 RepID=A0AAW0N4J3_9GOBI
MLQQQQVPTTEEEEELQSLRSTNAQTTNATRRNHRGAGTSTLNQRCAVHRAISGTLQRPFDPGRLGEHAGRASPSAGSSGGKSGEYPPQSPASSSADSPWLRLLRGALANQKRAEPDRLRRGWNRGCFGLKLDRIGSMSGLGC